MKKFRTFHKRAALAALFTMALILAACLLPMLALSFADPMGASGVCFAGLLIGLPILRDAGAGEGGGGTGTATQPLTNEQFQQRVLGGVTELKKSLAGQDTRLVTLEKTMGEQSTALAELRKARLAGGFSSVRRPGAVSDEFASVIAAQFVAHCERSGMLEALTSSGAQRDALMAHTRNVFGISTKTALTASDFALPTQLVGQWKELISEFGVVRRAMVGYPIGQGTSRPARMGTRPAFGSIAMSGPFGEKSPTVTFASLESHKIGGLVRMPREIDEQSIINMGAFLARYGAVEFARAEDTWGFLADGSSTYENVKGIVQVATEQSKTLSLANTKTKPSDATLADFRALRRLTNKAALNGRLSAYYLDTTWETALAGFKTAQEPNVYQRLPDGSAILDGYPIVWTDVLQSYTTDAAAGKPIAVFGALSFWWMGEHGAPRMDTSEHVYFVNDQIGVRFIEEIDFDYAAADATAALLTAAS